VQWAFFVEKRLKTKKLQNAPFPRYLPPKSENLPPSLAVNLNFVA